ncbi:ArsR/SmtB family transcription factor [Nocardioides lijunqiniae]|uniref:ArsR/SmtB family transcription factor n=1 Tax=Nocardioides lijunqiniae TaxID=2760832 RepID=UPI0018786E58|nr:metalloregulator ArsR/SmtB family transcription factor [Nocardioides lijunqiniae]
MKATPSPGKPSEYADVSALFAALSAPVRAAIVHRLADRPHSVGELVDALEVTQPLVSQHLRVLRGVHLVTSERRAQEVVYSLADEHVAHIFLDAWTHLEESRS